MEYDDLPVLRQLHVQLDPIARARGEAKGRQRVLRHGAVPAVQAAVGVVDAAEGRALPSGGAPGGKEVQRRGHGSAQTDEQFSDFLIHCLASLLF